MSKQKLGRGAVQARRPRAWLLGAVALSAGAVATFGMAGMGGGTAGAAERLRPELQPQHFAAAVTGEAAHQLAHHGWIDAGKLPATDLRRPGRPAEPWPGQHLRLKPEHIRALFPALIDRASAGASTVASAVHGESAERQKANAEDAQAINPFFHHMQPNPDQMGRGAGASQKQSFFYHGAAGASGLNGKAQRELSVLSLYAPSVLDALQRTLAFHFGNGWLEWPAAGERRHDEPGTSLAGPARSEANWAAAGHVLARMDPAALAGLVLRVVKARARTFDPYKTDWADAMTPAQQGSLVPLSADVITSVVLPWLVGLKGLKTAAAQRDALSPQRLAISTLLPDAIVVDGHRAPPYNGGLVTHPHNFVPGAGNHPVVSQDVSQDIAY
ncbi:MAG: hypothetical protein IPL40_12750 [Proteobacteria bacterium]|nr:hypothetical protein [Pseudomonadota bacterium]